MDETISLATNLGIGAAMIFAMFQFAKWLVERSIKQIDETNQKIFDFMSTTLKENTKAMNDMVLVLKEHIQSKEKALELLHDAVYKK